MEAGVETQGVEVGIFRGPIFEERAVLHHFSEALEGIFGFAEKGIDAGNVVENRGFFGIDGEGAAGPVVAFCVIANARENSGA